jgi:hypothetical protein
MCRAVAKGNEITNCTAGIPRERRTDVDADQGGDAQLEELRKQVSVQSGRSFWAETSTEGRAAVAEITLL